MTARWACFALWGPRAREILAPLTDDPLDFAYMRMRELAVGDVPGARAARDVRRRARLGAVLPDASTARACGGRCGRPGASTACVAGGYRAIDSLRLEKGYRVWAADITPDETPVRGRPRLLRARRTATFIGPTALGVGSDARRAAAAARLRCLVLEDPRSVALGNEPVRVGGEIAGRVTSGGYGYTVERSIAYAYVPAELELGTAGRGRHLRAMGRRRGRARAAVRPQGRARAGATA